MKKLFVTLIFFFYFSDSYAFVLTECSFAEKKDIPAEIFEHYQSIMPTISVVMECKSSNDEGKILYQGYSATYKEGSYCFIKSKRLDNVQNKIDRRERFLSFGRLSDEICETKNHLSQDFTIIDIDGSRSDILERYFESVDRLSYCLNTKTCANSLLKTASFSVRLFDENYVTLRNIIENASDGGDSIKIVKAEFPKRVTENVVIIVKTHDGASRYEMNISFGSDGGLSLIRLSKIFF